MKNNLYSDVWEKSIDKSKGKHTKKISFTCDG